MPKSTKTLKPQYESKKENVIALQKSKVDRNKEYSSLSKIIEENKKIEDMVKVEGGFDYKI